MPEKGRSFVTVRAVTANLVSKDARDFKEKSHETARRDLLALRTYRVKCLGGAESAPHPAFLGLRDIGPKGVFSQEREQCECRKNGKVQHSYFRLQKFATHARGFVHCSQGFVNCSL